MSRSSALIAIMAAALTTGCATTSYPGSSSNAGTPYRERRSYEQSAPGRVLPETARVYTLADVSTQPRIRVRRPPSYPFELRRAGVQGEAVISFVVSENGMVANARVERATHPALGEAALVCVQGWEFVPAMRNGRPVNVQMSVPLVFTVN